MRNSTDCLWYYITVLRPQIFQSLYRMNVGLILYALLAVIMVLLILMFVLIAVVLKCRKRKRECSEWIPSASIEHLRFDPAEVEAQMRSSTPYYAELSTFNEFFRTENNNRGDFYSQLANYSEPVLSPSEMQVIENKSRQLLQTFPQTFSKANEPKFIYWETRV